MHDSSTNGFERREKYNSVISMYMNLPLAEYDLAHGVIQNDKYNILETDRNTTAC
jgi:hypothetical protein